MCNISDYLCVEPDYAKQFTKTKATGNAWARADSKGVVMSTVSTAGRAGWAITATYANPASCEIAQDVYEKYYLKLADISHP